VVERGVILAAESAVIDVGQLFTSGEQLGQRSVAVCCSGSLVRAESLGATDAAPVLEDDLDRVSRMVNSLLSGTDAASSPASLDDLETVLRAAGHGQWIGRADPAG
jgi:hypothetical protein